MLRLQVNDPKDIVHRDGGDTVHHEPGAQVMVADLLGVQDDVAVLSQDPSAKVENQIHEEKSVRQDVEGDPWSGVLVLKEGDAPGQHHQITHHQQEHHYVPVEPGQNSGIKGSGLTNNERFLCLRNFC